MFECWPQVLDHRAYQVGDASFTSPEDGKERKARLYLSTYLPDVSAYTIVPGQKFSTGELISPEGYFSLIINRHREYEWDELLANLLHEITHVVDPWFLIDAAERQTWSKAERNNAYRQYRLVSEQRAFTAMWAAEMIRWISKDRTAQFREEEFAEAMTRKSREFQGFWVYNFDLHEQSLQHFTAMADRVRSRPDA